MRNVKYSQFEAKFVYGEQTFSPTTMTRFCVTFLIRPKVVSLTVSFSNHVNIINIELSKAAVLKEKLECNK